MNIRGAFGEIMKTIRKVTNQVRAIKVISKEKASKAEVETLRIKIEIFKNLVVLRIVHRDLKPESILQEANKPQSPIKDLFASGYKMNQKLGTPEVLERRYDEKCYVWSCGVIFYIFFVDFPLLMEILKRRSQKALEWTNYRQQKCKRVQNGEQVLNKLNETNGQLHIKIRLRQIQLNQLRMEKKFQEAALTLMINQMATSQQKQELLSQSQALDLNGDERLSKEELIIGYQKLMSRTDRELE
ncbi:unnamed protein product (macronuclear) [Paramecium tetraurelia]|uniref:Protein kinase domain-containing protein n=1 Tax=Paramecium tetraurelia TaxID=5888 RepID=A0EIR5_PARTE|nr:uncharacterized protein GSPATT00027535001 [Paramecium tetraurelia]CAK95206.1 unnamed protein product [Paramecium tetraurelia]|eukprot:XP_001462579.1 hypothetical protein (macronuclear) [Paramecium tetraurelia strain d4-2]